MTTFRIGKKRFGFALLAGVAWNGHRFAEREPPRLKCQGCGFVFYLDPKVAACTVIDRMEPICFSRERFYRKSASGSFRGGYVDLGEPVEAAAVRETREEANNDVSIDCLLGVYSYPDSKLLWSCTRPGGRTVKLRRETR